MQALANSAWGLAVLGHLHPAFFLKLRSLTLCKLGNTISEELHQLYQVELILRLEAPDLGLDTSHIQDSDALFAGEPAAAPSCTGFFCRLVRWFVLL